MKHFLLITFLAACVVHAAPPIEYVMQWRVAGVPQQSQPVSRERCERLVKDQPNLRAVCVPLLK